MTSTSDRPRRRLPLLALVAASGALAAMPLLAGPGPADAAPAAAQLRAAHVALGRGDGIAAEIALRQAMAAGLPRDAAAARMGEAFLDQGDLGKARAWLAPAAFTAAEAPHGWRMLGRLEMASGNLPAAGKAFDRALQLAPRDSRLWVDISRLRYQGGEQLQALAAADTAVRLDPRNVRALEWRGLLVRDSFGLRAALPWFEAGLAVRPDDLSLLGEYAATLGELGRARDMLAVTRQMLALDPRSARAFYLQAVLAARGGDVPLARRLLVRAGPRVLETPAGLLLSGSLELEAGNAHLAVELLDRLTRLQPENQPARLLLARALAAAGNRDELATRFAAAAAAPEASPYLAAAVAQAFEAAGRRDEAAGLLDAAARARPATLAIAPVDMVATTPAAAETLRVRRLAAAGDLAGAAVAAQRVLDLAGGSAAARVMAGDVAFLRGLVPEALAQYRAAAAVRLGDPLVLRITACLLRSGQPRAARQFVAQARSGWPRDTTLLRLEAGFAAQDGQWPRAARVVEHLGGVGLGNDAMLQADRALALVRSGRPQDAWEAAASGYALAPLTEPAVRAYALAAAANPARRAENEALATRLRTAGLPGPG